MILKYVTKWELVIMGLLYSFTFWSCGVTKQSLNKLTLCDTIQASIEKDSNAYKPVIINLDPKINVYAVRLEDIECYQITWKNVRIFNKYELWLDNIPFEFSIGDKDCLLEGDNVIGFVNQRILGDKCLQKSLENTPNSYDCIFRHPWNIRVRGKICNDISGPFSNEIKNVSLQCSAPK